MKYIILEKARPYTRVRKFKLEHVKGYPSRPKQALDKRLPEVQMVFQIADSVQRAGGRALIVGGFVRDALMGIKSKDMDVEVYGVDREKLGQILSSIGKVDEVGASFGVFKVKNEAMTEPLDVSLPRRDNLVGVGHRGFVVETDQNMSIVDAASRRDLTINSMAYDPIKKKLLDPFGGLEDLKMKKLKATDPKHFVEDALRVLRVMQFAGRFGFAPDAELVKLCQGMDLTSLPKERLYTEFEKLLLKAKNPSEGFQYVEVLGVTKLFPELKNIMGVEQNPKFHPEGDVWEHTLLAIDEARKLTDQFEGKDKMVFMLSALLHDIGKAGTTMFDEEKEDLVSPGHANQGAELAEEFLNRITDDQYIIPKVKQLIKDHMIIHNLYRTNAPDSAIRRLARRVNIPMLVALSTADKLGRGTSRELDGEKWMMKRYKELGLDKPEALKPLVMGRHLILEGVQPGVGMGKLLNELYEKQLEGYFKTTEEGIRFAREQGLIKSQNFKYIILEE